MIPEGSFDLALWPPTKQKLKVPHDGRFGPGTIDALKERGYEPVDIRFLSGPEAVRLALLGSRMGTVTLDRQALDALKLEATIHGMMTGRQGKDEEDPFDLLSEQSTLDILDNIRSHDVPLVEMSKNKSGRPLGALDQVMRKLRKDRPKVP